MTNESYPNKGPSAPENPENPFPSIIDAEGLAPIESEGFKVFGPELPLFVDSTMLTCFRNCPQKFFHEFCLGLRPAALSLDLHAGGCFAASLEAYYHAFYLEKLSSRLCLERAFKVFGNTWGDFPKEPAEAGKPSSPKSFANVWAAVESYFETYPVQSDLVQPFIDPRGNPTFEFTFAIPLEPCSLTNMPGVFPFHPITGDPFVYSGRFDMLGTYSGLPCVRDEKTTTSIGAGWSSQWDLRSQFIGYTWACKQLGIDAETVIVRGIGILKTKISHAEAIKQYSDMLRARWLEQVRRDLWRIVESWQSGYFDLNLADACSIFGGCPFTTICSSSKPENWYPTYQRRNWNPLLKNPISLLG